MYLNSFNYPNLKYVRGDVMETLPNDYHTKSRISLLRLDTDFYLSTMHELDNLYKHVNKNCLSDLGVSMELSSSSINGAVMNIKINLSEIQDKNYVKEINEKIDKILSKIEPILSELNKNIII